MSTEVYPDYEFDYDPADDYLTDGGDLSVTRYAGPQRRDNGDRRRWQFTIGGTYTSLNAQQVRQLATNLKRSLA